MNDFPLIRTRIGSQSVILLKHGLFDGKPYIPYGESRLGEATAKAREIEQAAIASWENQLGRSLTREEYLTGAVSHTPLSKPEDIAKQSARLSKPTVDANPAQTHLDWLLKNPGTTPGQRAQRKAEIKRVTELAKIFDAKNGARRVEAELVADLEKKSTEDTPENKAKTHALKIYDDLKKNPRASQSEVDSSFDRLHRLNNGLDITDYWCEFGLFNEKWKAKIDAEIKMKADEAAMIASQALEIEQTNTLENK